MSEAQSTDHASRLRYWAGHPAGQAEPMRAELLNAADEIDRLVEEDRQWEKHGLVQLVMERDRLRIDNKALALSAADAINEKQRLEVELFNLRGRT